MIKARLAGFSRNLKWGYKIIFTGIGAETLHALSDKDCFNTLSS